MTTVMTLVRMLSDVTQALELADQAYHRQFEGDDDAMKAWQHPEWKRLSKRARRLVKRVEKEHPA